MAEDTRQDKRASFSAITEHSRNGMARTSAVSSSKTGASKKLVIKNFKGTDADRLYVYVLLFITIGVCTDHTNVEKITIVTNFHTVVFGLPTSSV